MLRWQWGSGQSGVLGHGNTIDLRSPRLVKALSGRVVLNVSCGVNHTAAVVAIPGVTAYIGYDNQPFRQDTKVGRFGADVRVQPVSKHSLSLRRLSRQRNSTATTQTLTNPTSPSAHTAASSHRRGFGTPIASTGASVVGRPPSGASRISRRSGYERNAGLPSVLGAPENVPAGTVTYMKSAKRPGSYRTYASDAARKLADVPVAEQPSVDYTHSDDDDKDSKQREPVAELKRGGSLRQLAELSRQRAQSNSHLPPRSTKPEKLPDARKVLHKTRGLPPLANRVTPGTPAGELFTWGTGIYGQV